MCECKCESCKFSRCACVMRNSTSSNERLFKDHIDVTRRARGGNSKDNRNVFFVRQVGHVRASLQHALVFIHLDTAIIKHTHTPKGSDVTSAAERLEDTNSSQQTITIKMKDRGTRRKEKERERGKEREAQKIKRGG